MRMSQALRAEDKVSHQVSVLREAFATLQNTKKVCVFCAARSECCAQCELCSNTLKERYCFDMNALSYRELEVKTHILQHALQAHICAPCRHFMQSDNPKQYVLRALQALLT